MDTVQNIGSVIVGGQQPDVDNFYATPDAQRVGAVPGSPLRKPGRREFLSRPNWLFGHNENVLFCTALNSLRFRDHNNVPRKFIEEYLSERMVTMETEWYSGNRFLTETIDELKRDTEKFRQKKLRIWKNRQKGFYSRHQQNLRTAERAHASNPNHNTEKALDEARREASVPLDKLNPPEPSVAEVALEELQTKIIRRLQGQTDRLEMAGQLAHKPYEGANREYFEQLQVEVLQAISAKHDEISQDREKVELKSKQSRKRRRGQVTNGMTMSGSATRVRFTNREIAMLIHWVYSWPKDEWSTKISEYYPKENNARSAEHVRDKLRDLVNRSRDHAHGGLSHIKARTTHSYFTKPNEPPEVSRLALHDLQDFKYPEGELHYIPSGRYFDEERAAWVDGPLPLEYVRRYHEEIDRLRDVVKVKVVRNVEKNMFDLPGLPQTSGLHHAQQQLQHPQLVRQANQHPGAPQDSVYDIRLMQTPGISALPLLQGTSFGQHAQDFTNDPDFAMAKNLQEANNSNSNLYWAQDKIRDKDTNEDITALASAAIDPKTESFLQLEHDEPKPKSQKND